MKNSLFAFNACALSASVAMAAPATKVQVKAPAKVASAKTAPAKVTAKAAPTKVAQADSEMLKAEQMPGFFPDVPRDHWAFAAVQRLAAVSLVNGYPATPASKAPVLASKPDDAKDVKVAEATETALERVAAVPTEAKAEPTATPTDSAK